MPALTPNGNAGSNPAGRSAKGTQAMAESKTITLRNTIDRIEETRKAISKVDEYEKAESCNLYEVANTDRIVHMAIKEAILRRWPEIIAEARESLGEEVERLRGRAIAQIAEGAI